VTLDSVAIGLSLVWTCVPVAGAPGFGSDSFTIIWDRSCPERTLVQCRYAKRGREPVRITVTVTAKLESDTEPGAPVAEQSYFRVELDPALWVSTVVTLGEGALGDVSRMVGAAIAPAEQPIAP
jgi:hypothetical protein